MRTVGVKELKTKLSEYLRAVKRGETVIVTEHDEPIAELRRPQRAAAKTLDEIEYAMHSLAAAGIVARASRRKKHWRWAPRGLGLPATTVTTLLEDLRADSR